MSNTLEYPIKIKVDSRAATSALRSLQTDLSKLTPQGTDELLLSINFDSSKTVSDFKQLISNIKSYFPDLTNEFDLNIFSSALEQYKSAIHDMGYIFREELDPTPVRESLKNLVDDFTYASKANEGVFDYEETVKYVGRIQKIYNSVMSLRMNNVIDNDETKQEITQLIRLFSTLEEFSTVSDTLFKKMDDPLQYLQSNYKETQILEDELRNLQGILKNVFSADELNGFYEKILEMRSNIADLSGQINLNPQNITDNAFNQQIKNLINKEAKQINTIANKIFTPEAIKEYGIDFVNMSDEELKKAFLKIRENSNLIEMNNQVQEATQIISELEAKLVEIRQQGYLNANGMFAVDTSGFEKLLELLTNVVQRLASINTQIKNNIEDPINHALSISTVDEWKSSFLSAIDEIKESLSGLLSQNNTNIADTLFGWDLTNKYRSTHYKKLYDKEGKYIGSKQLELNEFASGFNRQTGQVVGGSLYDTDTFNNGAETILEAARQMGVVLDTYAHSHSDSRVASLSMSTFDDRKTPMLLAQRAMIAGGMRDASLVNIDDPKLPINNGDIVSFYEKYKLGIDTEIVKALDEVFVFDSNSFYTDFADKFSKENIEATKRSFAEVYEKYYSMLSNTSPFEQEYMDKYGLDSIKTQMDKKGLSDYVYNKYLPQMIAEALGNPAGFDFSKYAKTYTNDEFKALTEFQGGTSGGLDHLYDILSKISQLDFSNLSSFQIAQDGLSSIATSLGSLTVQSSSGILTEIDGLQNKFVELSLGIINTKKQIQELNSLKENGTITQEQQAELDTQQANLETLTKQRDAVKEILQPYSQLKASVSEFKEYLMEISNALSGIQESFAVMSDGNKLSGLESSFSDLAIYINDSAEAIKKMAAATSNIKTDINLSFGTASKEEVEVYRNDAVATLERQIIQLEGVFKQYSSDVAQYVVSINNTANLINKDELLGILNTNASGKKNLNSLRDYANLLMQLAEFKGIDISSITDTWEKMPNEVANFRKELNESDNAGSKLKQILSDLSNINFGALSSNIENINAILSDAYGVASEEQKALLQSEENNFDPLTQKISEVIEAIDAKTQAFVNEGTAVTEAIQNECTAFDNLIGKLGEVKDLAPSVSTVLASTIAPKTSSTSSGITATNQELLDRIKLLGLENNAYLKQLGNIERIEESVRKTKDGLLESYKFISSTGDSRTIGKNGELVAAKTQTYNISGQEKEFDLLVQLQDELKAGGRLSDEMVEKINSLFDKLVQSNTKASLQNWIKEFEAFRTEIGNTTDSYLAYAQAAEANNAAPSGAKFAAMVNENAGIKKNNQSAYALSGGSSKNGYWTGALADESNQVITKYNDIVDVLKKIKSTEAELSSMQNKVGGIQDQDILEHYNELIAETADNLMALRGQLRDLNVSEFVGDESNAAVLGEDKIQNLSSLMMDIDKQQTENAAKQQSAEQSWIDQIEQHRVKTVELRNAQAELWDQKQVTAMNKAQEEAYNQEQKDIELIEQHRARTVELRNAENDLWDQKQAAAMNKAQEDAYNQEQKDIELIEKRKEKTAEANREEEKRNEILQANAINKAQEEDWKSSLAIFDQLDAALNKYINLSKQAFGNGGLNGSSKALVALSEIEQKISEIVSEAERLNKKGILSDDKFNQLNELISSTNKDITEKYSQSISKYFDSMLSKSKEYMQLLSQESLGTLPEASKSRLEQLKAEYDEALQLYNLYSKINGFSEQAQRSMNNFSSGFGKSYADSLDKVIARYENGLTGLSNPKGYEYIEQYNNNLHDLEQNLEELKGIRGGVITQDQVNRAEKLKVRISDIFNMLSANRNSNDYIVGDPEKIRQNMTAIQETLNKNTRMPDELREMFTLLQQKYQIAIDTKQTRTEVKQLDDELAKLNYELQTSGKTGRSMWDRMVASLKAGNAQMLRMYLSWFRIIQYIKEAFNVIEELDTALVDLKKTTTMTNTELETFYNDASDIAIQTGVTTEEIISQAAAWSRLGYSAYETSTQMAQLSSQFAAISPGMDTDTATDGLVSSMKAFGIATEDVEREIMDNINRIGNTMATTNEEIVDMLERSSSAMAAANNSIEETIALESAAVEVTRDADTTGTAFKTISMRIRGYDEETEELSDDLENISGKIADLTKVNGKGGVSLFTDETKTTYKSTYQILKDISEVYDQLTDKNQAELLEALGGKRSGQVIAAVLNDFSSAEKAMIEMENAAGSADAEMSTVEESIEYKLNALKQTWVGFLQEILQRDDVADVVDSLIEGSEGLTKALDTLGPLLKVVMTLLSDLAVVLGDVCDIFGSGTPYVLGFSAAMLKFSENGAIKKWLDYVNSLVVAETNMQVVQKESIATTEAAVAAKEANASASELEAEAKLKAMGISEEEIATHEAEVGVTTQDTVATQTLTETEVVENATTTEGVIADEASAAAKGVDAAATETLNIAEVSENATTVEGAVADEEATAAITKQTAAKNANTQSTGLFTRAVKAMATATGLSAGECAVFTAGLFAMAAALAVVGYQVLKAGNTIAENAKEIGESFSDTSSEIDEYKEKVESLQDTINDSSSSIDDVVQARKDLLDIQSEMIEKYGDEEDSANAVTDAINGQADAFDRLSQSEWNSRRNAFNNEEGLSSLQRAGSQIFKLLYGYTDNIEVMLDAMENYQADISNFAGVVVTQDQKDLVNYIQSNYEDMIVRSPNGKITLNGTIEEVETALKDIKEVASEYDHIGTAQSNAISDTLSQLQRAKNEYADIYEYYVLYDKIFQDNTLADDLNQMSEAYQEYEDAFISGDEDSINSAIENYANALDQAITDAGGDESVVSYFEDMYPELQEIVAGWRFEVEFDPKIDDGAYEILETALGYTANSGNYTNDQQVRWLLEADADNVYNSGSYSNDEQNMYADIHTIMDKYELSVDQIIDYMLEQGMIVTAQYEETVKRFGQDVIDGLSSEEQDFLANNTSAVIQQYERNIRNGIDSTEALDAAIKKCSEDAASLTSRSDMIDAINELSDGFDILDEIYADVKDGDVFDFANLDKKKFEDSFDTLGLADEYNDFIKVISTYPDNINKCQAAFNNLITAYIESSGILDDVTTQNADVAAAMLKNMGVANSEEIVLQALNETTAEAVVQKHDVANATEEEINQMFQEVGASQSAKDALASAAAAEVLLNNSNLNLTQQIAQLSAIATAAWGATSGMAAMKEMEEGMANGASWASTPTSAWNHVSSKYSSNAQIIANYTGADQTNKTSSSSSSETDKYVKQYEEEIKKLEELEEEGMITTKQKLDYQRG